MSSNNFFEWRIGIMNVEEKYLTAEGYGNRINACGTALRQKQTWSVEFHEDGTVYLRSYGRYFISVDRLGTVTCDAKERGENEEFQLEYATDGSARWAFRNKKRKYYLAGTGDKIDCLAKKASEEDLSLWYTPFAMHPQVTIFALLGRKYAIADASHVCISGTKAWGPRALFTVEFHCGKYRFKTADNRYLCKDGSIIDTYDQDTLFGIEIHLSEDQTLKGLTFKDNEGRFLSACGSSGILRAHQKNLRKEALFQLQECHPQVTIVGTGGKMASVGFEVMMKNITQGPTTSEIFQVCFHQYIVTKCSI
jgi:fascin 1/2